MIIEEKMQAIDVELSLGMVDEVFARADSMGLTVSEYVVCVLGQHVDAGLVLA